jgi:uncharacterized protein
MSSLLSRDPETIYMHMADGGKYYPFAPRAEDIHIDTIAHHLACAGRWNGATQHPHNPSLIYYSVAEHSVYVSEYMEHELRRPDLALQALLHDAPEYVVGDMIRPMKYSAVFHKPFKAIEEMNEKVINAKFGLPFPLDPLVKVADEAVCTAEAHQIVPKNPDLEWDSGKLHDEANVANITIEMLLPKQARDLFMGRYWTCLGLIERTKELVA